MSGMVDVVKLTERGFTDLEKFEGKSKNKKEQQPKAMGLKEKT